jgi:hypothetical protein
MAKSRRGADQGEEQNAFGPADIRYDDFIRRIRPRPDNTDPITVLHGYIGESTTEDRIRLYSDASLSSYVEIAIADILFSLPNEDDPLGGSRIWVRQNANVQYNEASAYAQGDMYNDYMTNAYTPGSYSAESAAAVSVGQLACPVAITRPAICGASQFVCPTPASRLVVCRTILIRCRTLNVVQCATPRNIKSICRPCYVTPPGPGPGPIGGGVMNDPYTGYTDYGGEVYGGYGDYTGGQLYDDYANNMYDPGGYTEFGPAQPIPRISFIQLCPSVAINCITRISPQCPIIRFTQGRPWCPPITCQFQTRFPTFPPRSVAGCPSDFCTPGGGFPGDPRGGGGGFMDDPYGGQGLYGSDPYGGYGDYTSGDVYNDYMSNAYTPEAGATASAAITINAPCITVPPTRLQFCNQPSVLTLCPTIAAHVCPTRQRTVLQCCITRMPSICCPPTHPGFPPCRTRLPFCRTVQIPLCRPTLPPGCPTGFVCGANPGGGAGGGNFFGNYDPYGYGYGY